MLTAEMAKQLITAGENYTTEFKSEAHRAYSDDDLKHVVVCLANGAGGVILIGVEDDGSISGAKPRHGEITDVRLLDALFANQTVPSLATQSQVIEIDGKAVLAIEVPRAGSPVSTNRGTFKKRVIGNDGKPACVPYPFHEMQSSNAPAFAQDFSARVLPSATWNDLDPLEFERIRQVIRKNPQRADAALDSLSDADMMRALGLVEGGEGSGKAERITVAGLLIAGKESAIRTLVPTHEVAFQVRKGSSVAVNDFFRKPLVWVVDEFERRFSARNQEAEFSIGSVRVGIPDYSYDGFREALNNALVHRDYAQLGAVHLQWSTNEIEFMNPGGFVQGVTLQNILVAQPNARNTVLADAFKRIGLVERTGRGVDRIYEGQLRYGRPAPDYSRSTDQSVQVILRGGKANLELARWFIEHYTAEEPVTVEDMIIMNSLHANRNIDVLTASRLLQRNEEQAMQLLERLVDKGAVEVHDRRNVGRIYQLSASSYAAIGESAAYSRRTEFTDAQNEQMVISHLNAYDKITRADAAELCQLSSADAKNLLKRLVSQNQIDLHANGRWSFYTKSTKKAHENS